MKKSDDNKTAEAKHWSLLWACFNQITAAPVKLQSQMLQDISTQHPELFPELDHLLKSHQTESSILDKGLSSLSFGDDFRPPKTIGGFEILEALGSGGSGDVYRARKQEAGFERIVAIKFAPAGQYSALVLNSFSNELKLLLSLNHPHIERLYEGGVTGDGIPYLVVEYIDGHHIDDYCDQHKLGLRQRIKLFLQVCDAVSGMHQSLVIHRDIKASNIMVDAAGNTKLLDFGLAKLTENTSSNTPPEFTASGFMMTLAYASPEQVRGQNITTSSDVYSLGMLLYYLLAGRLPYAINNHDLVEITQQINTISPPFASQNIRPEATINATESTLKSKLKGDLDAILAKAISKSRERRYASAQQLADDLTRYLKNEPVLAKPDAVIYRVRKFIQRHVFAVSTTAAVMLSLLTLAVLLFNRSHELQRALQATQAEQQRVSQVTQYLIDVFKLSDPLQNKAEIVGIKDLLDASSQQLEHQFNQQPATKAKLYQTLAAVYLNMSDIQAAQKLLDQAKHIKFESTPIEQLTDTLIETELLQKQGQLKAAWLRLNLFERSHPDVALPVNLALKKSLMAGQLLYQMGELNQAIDVLQGAGQQLQAQGNLSDPIKNQQLQADIHYLLGNVYWKQGDLELVELNYQKSYDSNALGLGLAHHNTLKSLSALGVLAYSQGRYELAKTRFEQVLAARIKHLGNLHYLTADAHNRLGAAEYELGDLAAAERHYQLALDAFVASGLGESIKLTRVLNNLGLIKRQQKQYQVAELLFQQALEIQAQKLGADHPDLSAMLNNLGLTAFDQGNFEQALLWFEQAYQVQFAANGLNNANIAFAMTNMGRMYLYLNQPAKAGEWIQQALQLRADHLGLDHLLYAATLMAEAEWYLAVKNHEKAANSADKALKIRTSQLGQNDWRLADSRHFVFNLIDPSDAATQQICADAETIKQRFGQNHPRVLSINQRLQSAVIKCSQ